MTYHDILDEAALERSTSQYIRKDISEHKEGEPYVILYGSSSMDAEFAQIVNENWWDMLPEPNSSNQKPYYDGTLGYEPPEPKYERIGYWSVTGKPKETGKELTYKLSAAGNSDIK